MLLQLNVDKILTSADMITGTGITENRHMSNEHFKAIGEKLQADYCIQGEDLDELVHILRVNLQLLVARLNEAFKGNDWRTARDLCDTLNAVSVHLGDEQMKQFADRLAEALTNRSREVLEREITGLQLFLVEIGVFDAEAESDI